MVKNELDVIEASILHHLEQGVDAMLIADNGSDDGTLDLLHEMARQYPVHVATDGLKAHEQAAKTSLLATAVARAGASWVVPFDADEFWFARDRTLSEHLVMSTAAVELATTFDVLPVQDLQGRKVDRIAEYRLNIQPSSFRKVCFRAHRAARLSEGNHGVGRGGRKGTDLVMAHLQWRSFDQFERKVRQGKQALDLTNRAGAGAHWRALGLLSSNDLTELWSRLMRGEPDDDIWWGPTGPFSQRQLLLPGPTTWNAVTAHT